MNLHHRGLPNDLRKKLSGSRYLESFDELEEVQEEKELSGDQATLISEGG